MKKTLPVLLITLLLALLALVAYRLTHREPGAKDPLVLPSPELAAAPAVELTSTQEVESGLSVDEAPLQERQLADAERKERRKRAPRRSSGTRSQAEERAAKVRGRVLGFDGKPVAGAVVYGGDRRLDWDWPLDAPAWREAETLEFAEHVTPIWTKTNKEGYFELEGLAPGPGRIAVRHEEHALHEQDGLALAPDSPLLLEEIDLRQGLLVQGAIVDADGRAVSGAKIGALRPERAHWTTGVMTVIPIAETDGQGLFSSSVLPPGDWRLFVHRGDQVDRSISLTHDRKNPAQFLRIELERPRMVAATAPVLVDGSLPEFDAHAIPCAQVLTLPPGETGLRSYRENTPSFAETFAVEIEQLDVMRGSRTPVPARFQANYRKTTMNPDGTCSALALRPGVAYTIRALRPQDVFLVPDAFSVPQMILPRDTSSEGESHLFAEETVELDVRPTLVYEPMFTLGSTKKFEGAKLRVTSDGRRTLHGRVLSDLLAVRPTNPTATQFELEVDAPTIEKTTVLVPLPKAVRSDLLPLHHRLVAAPALRVRVTGPGGQPIADAHVQLAEAFGVLEPRRRTEGLTDESGLVLLRDTPHTRRNLGVSAPGYAPLFLESPFEMKRGETLDVRLGRGTSVVCKLRDSEGEPVRGALVLRLSDDEKTADLFGWHGGSTAIRYSDSKGMAQFHGLSPGRHRFGVLRSGRRILPSTEEEAEALAGRRLSNEDGKIRQRAEKKETGPTASADPLLQAFDRIDLEHMIWVDITDRDAGKVLQQELGIDLTRHFDGLVTRNGKGLADVRVAYIPRAKGGRWAETTTSEAGFFSFPWLPAEGGQFELRHHEWDLPLYETAFGEWGSELHTIETEAKEVVLRISWLRDSGGPLEGVEVFRTYDFGSTWDREASLAWNENSKKRDFVTDLLFSPPPAPLAVTDLGGSFLLRVPETKRTLDWALRTPDLGLSLGQSYLEDNGEESVLHAEPPRELTLHNLSLLRERYELSWIGVLNRRRKTRHWTQARILQIPESGEDLSMGKLPWGTYDVIAFNRDGFGRPIEVENLGRTRLSSRRKGGSFTIRQL